MRNISSNSNHSNTASVIAFNQDSLLEATYNANSASSPMIQTTAPTSATSTLSSAIRGAATKSALVQDVSEQILDSVESVDLAMRLMDQRHHTQFYAWIKDEQNVDYIAFYCKRIVKDYDIPAVARGFQWMFQEWSVNAIAGLLIKIFYENGLDDERFAGLVCALCAERSWQETIDLM